jgi:hypothetical protein
LVIRALPAPGQVGQNGPAFWLAEGQEICYTTFFSSLPKSGKEQAGSPQVIFKNLIGNFSAQREEK